MYIQTLGKSKALWYENTNNQQNTAVLFLPGFPKYPGSSKYIQLLMNKGYNVLMPMYSGSFESDGQFSIEKSVNDAYMRYKFLTKGQFSLDIYRKKIKKYKIKNIVIVGVSYGGLVSALLLGSKKLPLTQKVINISMLWNMKKYRNNLAHRIEADKTKKLLKIAFTHSYRLEDTQDFFKKIKGEKDINLKLSFKINNNIHKYIFHGKNDKVTPIDMSNDFKDMYNNVQLYELEGGHSSEIDINKLEKVITDIL